MLNSFWQLVNVTEREAIITTDCNIELNVVCIRAKIHAAAANYSSKLKNIVKSSGPSTEP